MFKMRKFPTGYGQLCLHLRIPARSTVRVTTSQSGLKTHLRTQGRDGAPGGCSKEELTKRDTHKLVWYSYGTSCPCTRTALGLPVLCRTCALAQKPCVRFLREVQIPYTLGSHHGHPACVHLVYGRSAGQITVCTPTDYSRGSGGDRTSAWPSRRVVHCSTIRATREGSTTARGFGTVLGGFAFAPSGVGGTLLQP